VSVRVSLVQAPVWGVQDPPLGLAVMAGCAKHSDQEPRVFDWNVRLWSAASPEGRRLWDWDRLPFWSDAASVRRFFEQNAALADKLVEETLAADPHAVAFSVALGSHLAGLEAARRVKARNPGVTVILGGPYFEDPARVEECIADPAVDMVLAGAGDDMFVKTLGLYKACGRWVLMPGMTLKSGGQVQRGPKPVPFTFDLDLAPRAEFEGFPFALYARPDQMPLSASRGCASKCRFCGSREYWFRYSFKSGDKIFGEVAYFRQKNPAWTRVRFYDINANGHVPSLVRFSEMVSEHGLFKRGLSWRMNASVKPEMAPPALAKMAAAGCEEIVYGVESGSAAVLERMNKPAAPELASRVLRDTHEAGIRATAALVAGYPGETEADFRATLAFLRENRAWIDAVSAAPLVLEEHSYLGRESATFGLKRSGAGAFDADWSADGLDAAVRQERLARLRSEALGLGLKLSDDDFTPAAPRAASPTGLAAAGTRSAA
jgi:radical SAM superfamily enzyme YgiQ (UPF0313 family)